MKTWNRVEDGEYVDRRPKRLIMIKMTMILMIIYNDSDTAKGGVRRRECVKT